MAKISLTKQIIEDTVRHRPSKNIELSDTTPGLKFRYRNEKFYWYLRFNFKSKEHRLKLGDYPSMSLSEARKCAIENVAKIKQGINPIIEKMLEHTQHRTFIEVATLWLDRLKQHDKSYSHISKSMKHIELIKKSKLINLPINQIRTIDIENLLQPHWNKPYMHNRFRSSLISIFRFALKHDFINKSPCIQLPKANEEANDKVFTRDEYLRVVNAAKSIDSISAKCILLMAYTGCRPSEAYSAKWSGFDLGKRTWTREATNTKQRVQQTVGISTDVVELLESIQRNSVYVFPSILNEKGHLKDIRITWNLVCEIANVKGTQYMLRKFVASELMHNGASIAEVQRLMAWKDASTALRHYIKVHSEQLGSRMDELMGSVKKNPPK